MLLEFLSRFKFFLQKTCTYKLHFLALLHQHTKRMESTLQYQVLYHRLKQEILADVYPIGSVLPSENELCASTSLSRSTIRQALAQLESEGYIYKQKGKGSIVKSKSRALNLLSFQGFSAILGAEAVSTLSVQEPELSPWPAAFFFELSEMEKGAGCIQFSRVRSIEGQAVMYEQTFVPNLNLPKFVRQFKSTHSFFEFLAKTYQVEITGMQQQIWAIPADAVLAQHLELALGFPLLKISRKYSTNRKHLHLYSLLYCNTEKYALGNSSGAINSNT